MKDKLVELAEKVEDQESFLAFVRELVKDRESAVKKERGNPSSPYGPDAGGWENTSIESYLESAVAWAEDSQFGSKMAFPEYELNNVSEWRKFAAFLMAGRVYE
ncbi:DUF7660 family protein [Methylomonas rivi]|uniref:DUF7660 domain-containing protein n=1 Tax=Methylomonas rivi TaxID=2952226 RepID=A0ABT1U9S6_9GAMM|nr:hypothetical protein [Methylomonas sp. WSC-6]MCQ8130613.1 hypothetical protein [Methylomonas sp. WSC-6]